MNALIDEITIAVQAEAGGQEPDAHTRLLQGIQNLLLAAEKPEETAKRLMYQVSPSFDASVAGALQNIASGFPTY